MKIHSIWCCVPWAIFNVPDGVVTKTIPSLPAGQCTARMGRLENGSLFVIGEIIGKFFVPSTNGKSYIRASLDIEYMREDHIISPSYKLKAGCKPIEINTGKCWGLCDKNGVIKL